MIIIGSVAAKLNDCLPTWRNGKTNDLDIVTNDQNFAHTLAKLSNRSVCVKRFSQFPEHTYVLLDDRTLVDITTSNEFYSLLQQATGNRIATYMEMDVILPDMTTLATLKEGYEDLPIHRRKNDMDLEFWRSQRLEVRSERDQILSHISKTARMNLKR